MKIVIADDEEIILKWMKKNVELLFPEHEVAAICTNGKQALDCCREFMPDILFTDIRMPVMDGMELLKQLKTEGKLPYTIILSAYDDFSYAREALKLGVKEFLLKSEIVKEELENCIQRAEEVLKNIENQADIQAEKKGEVKEFLENFLRDDVRITPEILLDWERLWGGNYFTIMLLRNANKTLNMNRVEEITDFFFQEKKQKVFCVLRKDSEALLLAEVGESEIEKLSLGIFETFISFGNSCISLNAGEIGKDCEDLKKIYKQAEKAADYQQFYEKTGVLNYACVKETGKEGQIWEVRFKGEEEIWMEHDYDRALENMQEIFDMFRKEMPDMALVRHLLLDFILNIYWNHLDETQRKKFSIDEFILISHCKSIRELEHRVLVYMKQFVEVLKASRPVYSEAVCKVIQYIEENYRENISLEELAKHVHMNKSYLSHLFKKETEKNIYTYLLDFRMEKAKKLLIETKQSVYQTGCLVGIPDSAYFSKVFKKNTGMTPLEFRKTT